MKVRKGKVGKPIQVKLDDDLLKEVEKVSEANALGVSTIIRMCTGAGIEMVKTKLTEMRNAKAA